MSEFLSTEEQTIPILVYSLFVCFQCLFTQHLSQFSPPEFTLHTPRVCCLLNCETNFFDPNIQHINRAHDSNCVYHRVPRSNPPSPISSHIKAIALEINSVVVCKLILYESNSTISIAGNTISVTRCVTNCCI